MPDETKYSIVASARRILANDKCLPLGELVNRILNTESLPTIDIRAERATTVTNILQHYIDTGYFVRNGELICAHRGPWELLLNRGFVQTHINHGTDNDVLLHFNNPAFPNVYFQIFEYGDGTWSHYIATHRTKDEYAEVENIVSELNKLPGKISHNVWP
jgi:hypothetical protein